MMRRSRANWVAGCLMLLSAILLFSPGKSHGLDIAMGFAPNVLNIQSSGTVVTVHTDLNYSLVDVYTVYLNGLAIKSWKIDNCGDFVAKFSMDQVKKLPGLVIGDYNTFQFVGLTVDGEPFVREQDIMIIDVVPQAR